MAIDEGEHLELPAVGLEADIFELLDRMRTVVVRRKDQKNVLLIGSPSSTNHHIPFTDAQPDLPASDEFFTISYAEAYTLYNLTGVRSDRTLWLQPAPLPNQSLKVTDQAVENLPAKERMRGRY